MYNEQYYIWHNSMLCNYNICLELPVSGHMEQQAWIAVIHCQLYVIIFSVYKHTGLAIVQPPFH